LLFGGGTFAYRTRAYDRWVGVRGSGILDKRSFISGETPTSASAPAASPADLTDPDTDEGFSLVPLIIAFVVLVGVGFAVGARRSRR